MSGKTVFPGEELAEEEEYEASDGTYVSNGKIYASTFGELDLDEDECTARVITPNPVNALKIDDIIYATIDDTRKTMATATAICSASTDRVISSSTVATIHVSKMQLLSGVYWSDLIPIGRSDDFEPCLNDLRQFLNV